MKILLAAALAAGSLSCATTALAAPIIDTGNGTDMTSGYSLTSYQGMAGRFTLLADSQITGVQGWFATKTAKTVTATIYKDGDYLPSKALYTGDFSFGANGWSGLSGLNWSLAAGNYWVAFTTASNDFSLIMPYDTPKPLKGYVYGTDGNWHYSNVPLNFAVKINGTSSPSGVPEPASWAMLIGGFGMAGAAFRARRVRVALA